MCEKAIKAAAKVCVKGCPGNYPSCERCHQVDGDGMVFGKASMLGTNTECPLAKYNVPEQERPADIVERMRFEPTLADCYTLCSNCEHSGTETDYYQFCLDCPICMIRDSIEECQAEGRMS